MDISLPVTINTPARPGVFSVMPATSQDATIVLHINADTQSELASILGGAPAAPLTPTALAAQYSPAILSEALAISLAAPKTT